jgi:hypothetical protein
MLAQSNAQSRSLIKRLLEMLNPVRRKILAFLCRYLHEVSQKAAVNKMTPQNLAMCVSQAVMALPKGLDAAEAHQHVMLDSQAVTVLIEGYLELFDDVRITDDDFCTAEDLDTLRAPRLNMANVNHLIVRDAFRRESLIPWVPVCRVETAQVNRRPASKPSMPEPVLSAPLLSSKQKASLVLQSVFRLSSLDSDASRPDEEPKDFDACALFHVDSFPIHDNFTPQMRGPIDLDAAIAAEEPDGAEPLATTELPNSVQLSPV